MPLLVLLIVLDDERRTLLYWNPGASYRTFIKRLPESMGDQAHILWCSTIVLVPPEVMVALSHAPINQKPHAVSTVSGWAVALGSCLESIRYLFDSQTVVKARVCCFLSYRQSLLQG